MIKPGKRMVVRGYDWQGQNYHVLEEVMEGEIPADRLKYWKESGHADELGFIRIHLAMECVRVDYTVIPSTTEPYQPEENKDANSH